MLFLWSLNTSKEANGKQICMHMTTKAQMTKAKLDKWDHVKLQSFCIAKDHNREKSQHTEREKVFADHISDKGLKSKIDKELLQLNSGRPNNLILKRAEVGHLGGSVS